MAISLFVISSSIIYFLCFGAIRALTQVSASRMSFYLSGRFKVFFFIFVILQSVMSMTYIGKFGVFENNVLIFPFLFLVGVILILAGVVFSLMSYYELRKMDFTVNGLNQLKFGIFNKIRWPIFTGFILILFGEALVFNNSFGLSVCLVVFLPLLIIQSRLEEKSLFKIFEANGRGEDYKNYLKNTGLFFPSIVKFFRGHIYG
ncbi:MAG: methyltransferase [Candidatus Paceibacterota bacterium]